MRQLILFGPATDGVKVFTSMLSVEVNIGLRILGVNPDLTQYPTVHGAHELLTQNIEAMCCNERNHQSKTYGDIKMNKTYTRGGGGYSHCS